MKRWIVWRQKDGGIKAFLNVCTHRGPKLCPAEAGNARGMSCPYHGWAYGMNGALENVPVGDEEYEAGFRAGKGLIEVPLVESYRGFIFGCLDAKAPTLKDYLGGRGVLHRSLGRRSRRCRTGGAAEPLDYRLQPQIAGGKFHWRYVGSCRQDNA